MAISSYKTYLMKGSGTSTISYSKLIDIKDFPDLGGAPEMLETTTLSDKAQTYILGIQSQEGLEFTANYTAADYQALLELEDIDTPFAIYFGGSESNGVVTPTGSDGQFLFTGKLSARVIGKGVNEVKEIGITIAPTSPISFSIPQG